MKNAGSEHLRPTRVDRQQLDGESGPDSLLEVQQGYCWQATEPVDTGEKAGARSGSVGEGDWGFELGMSLTPVDRLGS